MKYTNSFCGFVIEYDEKYRPSEIMISGEKFTSDMFFKNNGYSWKPSAAGNILCFMDKNKRFIEIPQDFF